MAYRLLTDIWHKDNCWSERVGGGAGVGVEVPRGTGLHGWSSSPDRLVSYPAKPDESAATFGYIRSTSYEWAKPRRSPSNMKAHPRQSSIQK